MTLSAPTTTRQIRRRTRRDPKPHFKAERAHQLDAIRGCPALMLAEDHPAREVQRIVAQLDLSTVEAEYSSLGRHGYHPRTVLAVWVYASSIGLHHATKVARACATDAAMQFLSGGHAFSAGTLKRFRQHRGDLFRSCITQVIALAHARGLIVVEELATDSMRLRAHASTNAVRTVRRSSERLAELEATDRASLSAEQQAEHDAKLEKHRAALAECKKRERTSIVVTNPEAALMKFPSGAGLPGHRVTATAAGVSERFVVGVLVDASPADDGKLERAVLDARAVLEQAGVPTERLTVAADAGYFCETDLDFASRNRNQIDVLIGEGASGEEIYTGSNKGYFGRELFKILDDNSAICPAGKSMSPPTPHHNGRMVWKGIDCSECGLRPKCTKGKRRSLTANLHLERVRDEMRARMKQPGARERYGQRIATIEPVFSSLQDVMGFRRSSSRHAPTIVAEVLLKVLAHNVSRLSVGALLACVWWPATEF